MTKKIDGTREEVRKFGILFSIVFALVGLYLLYKGNDFWYYLPVAGGIFLLLGYLAYPVLKPVYLGWMKFAFLLGWINTRLILGLFFYLVMTPLGVGMRIFGKDLLDQKMDRSAKSYWHRREKQDIDLNRYERLF